jgi:hypothetical protein
MNAALRCLFHWKNNDPASLDILRGEKFSLPAVQDAVSNNGRFMQYVLKRPSEIILITC